MYTEERGRNNLIKDFISKLILIIIFILLLIWLVPWPNLDPLKDQIFNANLQTMKEAGISYFTTERLPEKIGDVETLTLEKMLDMHLLVPFTDRNGKACDATASYVSLEKQETEYLMKVNLKCSDKEDYILVHLGCYSYCTTDLCEKRSGTTETGIKPIATKTPTKTPQPPATPTPTPTSTPTPTPVVEYDYEYSKSYEAVYSEWTNWTTYIKKTNDGVVYGKSDLKEVEDLGYVYVSDLYHVDAVYQTVEVSHQEQYQVGTNSYQVCEEYDYTADATDVYRIDTDWVYVDNWYSGYNPPADTVDSRWIFQGVDFDQCGDDCINHPFLIYRQQTRKVTKYTELSNVIATCTKVVTKDIPIYITRTVSELKTVLKTPARDVGAYVRKYRVRTRKVLKDAYTDYVWSIYNDTSLLDDGYAYTGKTRVK